MRKKISRETWGGGLQKLVGLDEELKSSGSCNELDARKRRLDNQQKAPGDYPSVSCVLFLISHSYFASPCPKKPPSPLFPIVISGSMVALTVF